VLAEELEDAKFANYVFLYHIIFSRPY